MRKEWWKLFFRPEVFPLTGVIPEADTRAEVRILARLLPRGAKVLDVACGEGRHVLALARRGAGVTGLDFSAPYLAAARRRARAEGLRARFVRGDMRRIPFRGEFDAVLNLWTSFGYFPDPADDLRAARAMLRALKPGGLLVLELIDAAWLRRHFEARRWSRREAGWVLEESRLTGGADPACLTDWTFIDGAARVARGESLVRLYDRSRLRRLLERAGFERIRIGPGWGAGRLLAAARRERFATMKKR